MFVGTSTHARGTEQHLYALALSMKERGHDVRLLLHPEGFLAGAAARAGLPFTPAKFKNALDPRGVWPLLKVLVAFRPDWVLGAFGHEYFPITVAGWLTGARVALFRHLNTPLGWVTRRVLPLLFGKLIAVSNDMLSDLRRQGLPEARLALLHNPFDLRRFVPGAGQRAAVRQRLGVGDTDRLVGFAGAMNDAKGVPTLLAALDVAMRAEPSLHCAWLGDREDHARARAQLAPALLDRHHFMEWTEQVEGLYPAFDLLAVPSQWREPFGRVSVEAQACGVPVLASRVGGLPETLVEGESGALLPAGDVAAWAHALKGFAQQPLPTAAQRDAAVRSAARFDAVKIAAELEALLR